MERKNLTIGLRIQIQAIFNKLLGNYYEFTTEFSDPERKLDDSKETEDAVKNFIEGYFMENIEFLKIFCFSELKFHKYNLPIRLEFQDFKFKGMEFNFKKRSYMWNKSTVTFFFEVLHTSDFDFEDTHSDIERDEKGDFCLILKSNKKLNNF